MKRKNLKSGAVSIYIVVFLTLVFGVITLSFIRIIMNDAVETTNSDLYRSAYDSALAGVEDARIALIKYHDCLSQGEVGKSGATAGSCSRIIYEMEQGANVDDCDVVQRVLGREKADQSEVMIQEVQSSTQAGNATELAQAYTCVKITENTDDYLTTLTSTDDNRIIPLRSEDINRVNAVRFSWYSLSNGGTNYMGSKFKSNTTERAYTPPVVALDLWQTDTDRDNVCGNRADPGAPCFSLGELSANNSNSTGTDRAMLMFRPVASGGTNYVSAAEVLDHSDKYDNGPIDVNCNPSSNFYCNVTIELPDTFRHMQRAEATSFLRASLLYERPSTDISVTLCRNGSGSHGCDEKIKFTGVQAAIDSTGRANDLFRRVETRIELVDLNYPYPEYELYLSGTNTTEKHFYVTNSCWQSNNGVGSGCKNSDNLGRYVEWSDE